MCQLICEMPAPERLGVGKELTWSLEVLYSQLEVSNQLQQLQVYLPTLVEQLSFC
jgi:hypothetical protein